VWQAQSWVGHVATSLDETAEGVLEKGLVDVEKSAVTVLDLVPDYIQYIWFPPAKHLWEQPPF